MSCIGTAGHVDHGKSTLVKALTGIDPDRLAEEKERGMTIDLGFAWLNLPSGREVSIVDVPGHESFIKNMLAGVGGIDAALLVIAADEGIMPQTREHLAILDLLAVPRGVVALTKADLVDEEWLELVRDEIAETLRGTTLAASTIIPVSAYTRQGLPELLSALDQVLDAASTRKNIARPRLPVDRVFSLSGFGTIVTGTLLDGNFKVGQEVEILPQGIKTRVRSLQTHQQQIETAQPGSRVAMNVVNVPRSDIGRGSVVALPGQVRTTMLVDARIQLLAETERPLAHNTQVDFYSGSQEIQARVRLLDLDELQPGKSAWAQLRLSQPAVVARHDHFILRIPSPGMTIGGGEIVDVSPRYHRRHQQAILDTLERLSHAAPEELVLAALDTRQVARTAGKGTAAANAKNAAIFPGYAQEDIAKQCNLAQDVTQKILETLLSEGRVRKVGGLWCAEHVWEALAAEAVALARAYHQQYPLRSGISKEEWRTRLALPTKMVPEVFAALQAEGRLETVELTTVAPDAPFEASTRAGLIRLPGFTPAFNPAQQKQVTQLMQLFHEHPYAPPGRNEAQEIADIEVVNALIEQGQLVKLGDGVLFLRETYEEAFNILIEHMLQHEKITVSEARDVLGTSRKYVLPLLERMDALRITRRLGDERVLMPGVTGSMDGRGTTWIERHA
ncbi:MAG: selenocysteine-specific translation elongation factor [Ktedonobacteraceae bacterium]